MTVKSATFWTAWGTIGLVVLAAVPIASGVVGDRARQVERIEQVEAADRDHETRIRVLEHNSDDMHTDVKWLRQLFEAKQARSEP